MSPCFLYFPHTIIGQITRIVVAAGFVIGCITRQKNSFKILKFRSRLFFRVRRLGVYCRLSVGTAALCWYNFPVVILSPAFLPETDKKVEFGKPSNGNGVSIPSDWQFALLAMRVRQPIIKCKINIFIKKNINSSIFYYRFDKTKLIRRKYPVYYFCLKK